VLVAIDLNHVGGSMNRPYHEEGSTTTSTRFRCSIHSGATALPENRRLIRTEDSGQKGDAASQQLRHRSCQAASYIKRILGAAFGGVTNAGQYGLD